MTDAVLLPRDPSVAHLAERPGAVGWALRRTDQVDGPPRVSDVLIRCQCGRVMGIGTHSIAADGTIRPSIHHHDSTDAGEACGWHVFARLVGWDGGAVEGRQG